MNKLMTNRTVVVEGRYDAIKLNSITDANIITIDGFRIYSDKAKQNLLKQLAKTHGLILLLDADGAGFQMRHYITNLVGEENVLQLYTPAVQGKEKRKETAGKEGLLGVEGIKTSLLYEILATALANDGLTNKNAASQRDAAVLSCCPDGDSKTEQPRTVTYTDLYHWGFSGTEGSAARKTAFLQSLGLPPRLSKKELVNVLNKLYTYQELEQKQKAMFGE